MERRTGINKPSAYMKRRRRRRRLNFLGVQVRCAAEENKLFMVD